MIVLKLKISFYFFRIKKKKQRFKKLFTAKCFELIERKQIFGYFASIDVFLKDVIRKLISETYGGKRKSIKAFYRARRYTSEKTLKACSLHRVINDSFLVIIMLMAKI